MKLVMTEVVEVEKNRMASPIAFFVRYNELGSIEWISPSGRIRSFSIKEVLTDTESEFSFTTTSDISFTLKHLTWDRWKELSSVLYEEDSVMRKATSFTDVVSIARTIDWF